MAFNFVPYFTCLWPCRRLNWCRFQNAAPLYSWPSNPSPLPWMRKPWIGLHGLLHNHSALPKTHSRAEIACMHVAREYYFNSWRAPPPVLNFAESFPTCTSLLRTSAWPSTRTWSACTLIWPGIWFTRPPAFPCAWCIVNRIEARLRTPQADSSSFPLLWTQRPFYTASFFVSGDNYAISGLTMWLATSTDHAVSTDQCCWTKTSSLR